MNKRYEDKNREEIRRANKAFDIGCGSLTALRVGVAKLQTYTDVIGGFNGYKSNQIKDLSKEIQEKIHKLSQLVKESSSVLE